MPSVKRLTIVQNFQQQNRSVVLVPNSGDPLAFIIDAAKKKLRIKKPSKVKVFRSDGTQVTESSSILDLDTDSTILISSGEPFVGGGTAQSLPPIAALASLSTPSASSLPATNPSESHQPDIPSEAIVLAHESYVDPSAIAQLKAISKLQGVLSTIGMPDLHPGTTFPIGAIVITNHSTIRPALIGGDIGCGMGLYVTGISASEAREKPSWIANKIRDIEGAWEGGNGCTVEEWLREAGVISIDSTWNSSLGTIGGGNHFAELQVVEKIWDQDAFDEFVTPAFFPSSLREQRLRPGDRKDVPSSLETKDFTSNLFLLVHSGSRGLGQNILASTKSSLSSAGIHTGAPLAEGTEEFDTYLSRHDDACRWACCNRDLIAHRILERIDETYNPRPPHTSGIDPDSECVSSIPFKLKRRKVLDIWHNNVERNSDWAPSIISPAEFPTSININPTSPLAPNHVWVHRKGAAPSDRGLVIIPGSRGAYSFLVLPTGPQHRNGFSLAHGAGRQLTRTKALADFSRKYSPGPSKGKKSEERSRHDASSLETTRFGGKVICEDKDLLFEEIPEAYKDIENVVKDLADEGIVKIVATLAPVVTYKVRK
ncbi:tRNA-splicing ligase [Cantharellus anzutake]|uniref:tRNA-splicing ligase n=1 Tax=Cantharellus anzutake TaxID=1750568 RepID=UPI001905DC48|nr:tRNA-splicing ligase [Cantharellus anzutake]KAF8332251.1 tRNA-splicing ligase [Cantharellus anzutake]